MSIPPFQIFQIKLRECDFKHEDFIFKDEPEGTNSIKVDVSNSEKNDENIFSIFITFDAVYKGAKGGQLLIYIVYEGVFKHTPETNSPLTFDNFCDTNGPAIIYPYVREMATSLTSRAGIPPLILPPVSFSKRKEEGESPSTK